MVQPFILITDDNKKVITTDKKHKHDFVCPLSGESFKVRGKFWNHIKKLKLNPKDLDLDIKEDIKEENKGNLKNLFHKTNLEYLWTSYFKGKITKNKLEDLVGLIDLDIYKELKKIMNDDNIKDVPSVEKDENNENDFSSVTSVVDENNENDENDENDEKEENDENDEKDENTNHIIVNDNVRLYIGDIKELSNNVKDDSINMIYLDPPFNSDRDYKLDVNSDIGFDDKWSDSDYENFIENTIDLLYGFLKKDGTLFFHISSNEMYIPEKILRKRFKYVTPIFWKKCRSKNNVKHKLGCTIDIIFKCNKISNPIFNVVYQDRDENYVKNSFNNKDERGDYSLGHLVTENTKMGYLYEFNMNGHLFNPSSGWRIKKSELEKLYQDNRIHLPKKKGAKLYKKIYLHESPGKPCTDLWDDIHSLGQGSEKRVYPTEKPIKLLERLIAISTNENAIILDPMCGSATTGKASHNLSRNCILNDKNPDVIKIIKSRF